VDPYGNKFDFNVSIQPWANLTFKPGFKFERPPNYLPLLLVENMSFLSTIMGTLGTFLCWVELAALTKIAMEARRKSNIF